MNVLQPRMINIALLVSLLLLPACATPPPKSVPVSNNPAVIALTDTARAERTAYHYGKAAASLERALRIEPRNARLWYELAQLRMQEEEYQQAESLALRSNRFSGNDRVQRRANWQLISESRRERGDIAGAEKALEKYRKHK